MIDIFRSVGEYHFVITGNTNDNFCANSLTETDLLRMLCELLLSERFDAVVFFDSERGLFVYDEHSKEVLESLDASGRAGSADAKREKSRVEPSETAWDRIVSLLSCTEKDCAVVFSDMGKLYGRIPEKVLRALRDLHKTKAARHSVAVYIFREDIAGCISESMKNGTKAWKSFVRSQLGPVIGGLGSPVNGGRLLYIGTPGQSEVRALLLFVERCRGISAPRTAHKELSLALARYCAENRVGICELSDRLAALAHNGALEPETVLSEFALSTAPERAAGIDGFGGLAEFFAADGGDALMSDPVWLTNDNRCRLSRNYTTDLGSARSMNLRVTADKNVDKETLAGLFARHFFRRGTLHGAMTRIVSAKDFFAKAPEYDKLFVDCTFASAFGETFLIYDLKAFAANERGKAVFERVLADADISDGRFAVMLLGSREELERLRAADERLSDIFPISVDLTNAENSVRTPEKIRLTAAKASVGDKDKCPKTSASERSKKPADAPKPVGESHEAFPDNAPEPASKYDNSDNDDEPLLIDRVVNELDKMVGLQDVKRFIIRMAETVITSPTGQPLKNFCFVGAPGTGKTEFVGHFAKILYMLGMIKDERIYKLDGSHLSLSSKECKDVRGILRGARHGLLFIDEAYMLDKSSDGKSVIDALVTISGDKSFINDTAIVLAGYLPDISQLMRHNVGLKSRFPSENYLHFKSYSAAELCGMLEDAIKTTEFRTSRKYLERTQATLMRFLCDAPMNYGNGRYIKETYFANSCNALTNRLKKRAAEAGIPYERYVCTLPDEVRFTLTEEDIPEEMLHYAPEVGSDYETLLKSSATLPLVGKKSIVDFISEIGRMDGRFPPKGTMYYSISGPTGSGKKTSIMAISGAMRRVGLLSADNVVSATAISLQGEYQGHTSPNVRKLLDSVSGGTIAIRDPSQLIQGHGEGSFGQEALSELFDQMSLRNDISVALIDSEDGISKLCLRYPILNELLGNRFVIDDPDVSDYLEMLKIKMERESVRFDSEMSENIGRFMERFVARRGGRPKCWLYADEINRLVDEMIDSCRSGENTAVKKSCLVTKDNFPSKYKCWLECDDTNAAKLIYRDDVLGEFERERLRILNMNDRSTGCYLFIGDHGTAKCAAAPVFAKMLYECGVIQYDSVFIQSTDDMTDSADFADQIISRAGRGLIYIVDAHALINMENFMKRIIARFTDTENPPKCCLALGLVPSDESAFFGTFEKLRRMIPEYHRFLFEDYTVDELIELLKMVCDGSIKGDDNAARPKFAPTACFLSKTDRIFRQINNERNVNPECVWNFKLVTDYIESCAGCLAKVKRKGGGSTPDDIITLDADDIAASYSFRAAKKPPRDRLTMELLAKSDDRGEFDPANSYSFAYIETVRKDGMTETGSGVLITERGHLLTCGHIAEATLYTVHIMNANSEELLCSTARLVYKSYSADFSVLKLDVVSDKIRPLSLREGSPEVGEEVRIIGFPFPCQKGRNNYEDNLIGNISCCTEKASVTSVKMLSRETENGSLSSNVSDGFSGAPVISGKDGKIIGVICGSIRASGRNIDKDCFYSSGAFLKNVCEWIKEENEDENRDD